MINDHLLNLEPVELFYYASGVPAITEGIKSIFHLATMTVAIHSDIVFEFEVF